MAEVSNRKIRVLVGKLGVDTHDRAAVLLCQAFRDAGMEVIYTGVYQTPEMIVRTAIAEDVDVIALSQLDPIYRILFPEVTRLLKEHNASDICVVGGGTIAEEDKPMLEKAGITGNYGPGTSIKTIIEHITGRVKKERWRKAF